MGTHLVVDPVDGGHGFQLKGIQDAGEGGVVCFVRSNNAEFKQN